MYLRALQPDEYAHFLERWLREHGIDWPQQRVCATVPLVQEKIEKFSQYPDFVRFLFEDVAPPDGVDGKRRRRGGRPARAAADRGRRRAIEEELRGARRGAGGEAARRRSRRSGSRSPGSKVSPGLFESLELLGRDESLRRLRAAAA